MKKSLFFILLLTANLFSQIRYEIPISNFEILEISEDFAISQIGITEKTNKNDGEVEKYLHSVGLKKGNPYCYAGQYWAFLQAINQLKLNRNSIPIPKSGMANSAFNYAKKFNYRTNYIANIHDLITWINPKSYNGHIERVIKVGKAGWVQTIAFNTSNGKAGSQSNGNGVFVRQRNIYHPLLSLRIRGLVGFRRTNG